MSKTTDDAALLTKLNKAVAEANEAQKTAETTKAAAETAKDEFLSRSKTVGLLLLEAKELHPKGEDFKAFLKKVHGLSLSWAYELLSMAGGRTTYEELKKEARERKQKSRANKKKLPRPTPALKKPEPEPDSVTDPHVTESAEINIDERKAQHANLDLNAEERAAKASARCLVEFTVACRTWLPKITVEADRQKARLLVSELTSSKPKAEAA
jgi:hypothetical protein